MATLTIAPASWNG